MLPTEILDSPS